MPESDTETVQDTQPEEAEAKDEVTEPEPKESADTSTETEDDGARELWMSTVPELADDYDQMTAEVREKFLLNKVRAQSQADEATADTQADTATSPGKPGRPAPSEQTPLNTSEMRAEMARAFEEGDSGALLEALDKRERERDAVVLAALKGQDGRIDEMWVPMQVQGALGTVAGAVKGDLAAAAKLMQSGAVQDADTALKVAVYNRRAEVEAAKPKPKLTPDERAKRKADAIRADQVGRGSATAGAVEASFPTNPGEERAFLEQQEAAAEQRSKRRG